MISHKHGNRLPYALRDGIVYFHDWRYVLPGEFRYEDNVGQVVPLFVEAAPPPVRYVPRDVAHGIALVAQPAVKTGAVIPAHHDELMIFGGTVLHEEGMYRLWYECWLGRDIPIDRTNKTNVLRYAESDDGMTWRFPDLGLCEHRPHTPDNIVFGDPARLSDWYTGGSVFRDPSAPTEERYKMLYLSMCSEEELHAYIARYPRDFDDYTNHVRGRCVRGAVSPDGLHWTPLPEPVLIQYADTMNICEYDEERGTYVAYLRSWLFGRRTIGRSESADFRHFPLPEETIWPAGSEQPSDVWYGNGKTRMPGTREYHVMFPLRWRILHDEYSICLAGSPDNATWNHVPGGPVLERGPVGAWDGGGVFPGAGLVALPGDRIGMLYGGHPVPHKYPRHTPYGALGWATWQTGRLVALQAKEFGAFSLAPVMVAGRTVRLNFRTPLGGHIRVAVVGRDGNPLPGRAFADCDWLTGDHLDHPVTWHGQPHLGVPDDQPVRLRFEMQTAELFSVRFT